MNASSRAAGIAQPYADFRDVPARNTLQARFEVPTLVRALQLGQGGVLVEVGCGRGVALPGLRRLLRPDVLIGVDISEDLLHVAAERCADSRVPLVNGDVQQLPFADGSVDLIIDFGTCYHVADPAAALGEVARVLRPAGIFVHETPVSQHLAHPVRSFRKQLPWQLVPSLRLARSAVLWAAHVRVVDAGGTSS